jgi:hypothetical protein
MTPYRRLPGCRRGLFRGASVWLGTDHLLAVQSMRFREEYKRFYLRDVQAIVVADAPRFHISTRSIAIAVLWLAAWVALRDFAPWTPAVLWTLAAALLGAWVYVSAACSCTCRIYTAVSRDELRSVYRTWTARRFLREVEPRIAETQGVLEGDWAEALEPRTVGPPGSVVAHSVPAPGVAPARGLRARTLVSDVFIGTLLADAAVHAAFLVYSGPALQWAGYALNLVEVAAACAIFAQAYRKQIKPAMQKLAIATLVIMGALYYTRPFLTGLARGAAASSKKGSPIPEEVLSLPSSRLFHEVEIGANVLIAMTGLAIMLVDRDETGAS